MEELEITKEERELFDEAWEDSNAAERIQKWYASQLPEGSYKVVLKVKEINPVDFDTSVWDFCILNQKNEVMVESTKGHPALGHKFHLGICKKESYIMYVLFCDSLEDAALCRAIYSTEDEKNFVNILIEKVDKTQKLQDSPFLQKPKSQKDIYLSQAQSLAAKNANRITALENELRELRELQVFLKKARIPD